MLQERGRPSLGRSRLRSCMRFATAGTATSTVLPSTRCERALPPVVIRPAITDLLRRNDFTFWLDRLLPGAADGVAVVL